MIEVVSATRASEGEFHARSALGLSLRRLGYDSRLLARIACENRRGLPEVYNERITASDAGDILVFVHDDVWIDDTFFGMHVVEGLRNFDVIGVAGNRRRVAKQPSWACISPNGLLDDVSNLSGCIAQGKAPFGAISWFGPVPAECELLDGVLLAARTSVLVAAGITFDARFRFHFYDVDFCRAARQRGLRLGTWPICLTHQSLGNFGGADWREMYRRYLEKWQD
jgi:GT2 family glycosyltransferase